METDMILLNTNEDIILVAKPYCKSCMSKKLDWIKVIGDISGNEIQHFRKYDVRVVKVKCECHKSTLII